VVSELTAGVYADEGYATEHYLPVLRDVARRAALAEQLVAVDPLSGTVVGAVTLAYAGGPYAENAEPGDAVIRMLVVDPLARRQGVGTLLMRACMSRATEQGSRRVLLSTQEAMASAHRLYRELGFRREPAHDWQPPNDAPLLGYVLDL
jgi:ribosomal protein S18 acetylase RimI-like enzyme